MLYIKKHYPEKQYVLLIKKAQSWLKKACLEEKIE